MVVEGKPVPFLVPGLFCQLPRTYCHLMGPHPELKCKWMGCDGGVDAWKPRPCPSHLHRHEDPFYFVVFR